MNEGIRDRLLRDLGGGCNILSVTNCMTRVRVTVADESRVDENGVRETETVLGLIHDRENNYEIVVGPGRCRE